MLNKIDWKELWKNIKTYFGLFILGVGGWVVFLLLFITLVLLFDETGVWIAVFLFVVFMLDALGKQVKKLIDK